MHRADRSPFELMLNFTPEDLEANRRGLLTPAQRQTLDAFARHQTNWIVVYMIGGPLIIGAVVLVNFIPGGGMRAYFGKDPTMTLAVILVVLFALVLITLSSALAVWRLQIMKRGQVRQAVGPAHIQTISGMRGHQAVVTLRIKINNVTFFLPESVCAS